METTNYSDALEKIRTKLEKRRGYASRVVNVLYPKVKEPEKRAKLVRDVYNVVWGRQKDPAILKEVIKEARAADAEKDPSMEIVSKYLKEVA